MTQRIGIQRRVLLAAVLTASALALPGCARYYYGAAASSDPVDLTGWTLAAQVRKLPTSATILYDLAPTVTNAAEGRWQILIPDEVSRLWAWNSGMWDLRAEAPGAGQAIRLVSGTVTVSPAVTRT